ncbi:GumC family protein [Roseateles sp. BYS96W]|uniref:GumC family protein n=1 Tax=Pelomonas nitida TaxID=3299027 RepID=A0ABW7G4P4_9BURK
MQPEIQPTEMGMQTYAEVDQDGISLSEIYEATRPHLLKAAILSISAGVLAYGVALLLPPTFTARTSIISPQQQQNSAAAALASLGALAGFGGGAVKSPADQYVAIMQSETVSNRLIDRFKLMDVYEAKYRVDALKALGSNVRISAGKKDGLITVEVDDKTAERAAQIANAYAEELRWVSNNMALTEAQQRRSFFEQQLKQTKQDLLNAQLRVQKTGFTSGALKSEPRAAAESYARTKAEISAAEIRMAMLRKTLTENAPEVQQQASVLGSLRTQLAQLEQPTNSPTSQDYVSAFREFKYQEALFDIFAKQFEVAKLDEARDGTLVQVLDPAVPPERKSKPKRSMIAASSALLAGLLSVVIFACRDLRRRRVPAANGIAA